jgi:hypothetical protein
MNTPDNLFDKHRLSWLESKSLPDSGMSRDPFVQRQHADTQIISHLHARQPVIPPFLTGCCCRTHAAIFSFMAGVIPPMPIFERSLL